ncbi:CHAD domain-containing protein [Thiomicrorhabdus sp. ZW0627]|uniref:CHAD domain-containing protein n=1 Tax=Thiomicrorhabdus sp. ZW0627 TaxID=3039774 RepID=UPI0024370255|nr:CHAD domain-containing protein [Thiomicrorhabdus sp. ZW0627]MDG6774262.1 CHAD domain-containing protein [Thiomicrorhabdus sp. ZW0627]
METLTTDQWIEQHIKEFNSVGLAPLIQKNVVDLIDQALVLSQSDQRNLKESIHDLRVTFKRLRAYWRLVRDSVDKPVFEAADRRIKYTAKLLGGQRDQYVLFDSLSLILDRLEGSERMVAESLLRQLNHSLNTNFKTLSIRWSTVISSLQLERSVWSGLDFESIKNRSIQKALHKSVTRSLRLSEQAVHKKADTEKRHRWRKWVKYVFYQLKLLKGLGVKSKKQSVRKLDELGNLLGIEHDMDLLKDFLQQGFDSTESRETLARIVEACEQYQKQLRKQVKHLAEGLYASP